jgi:type II secretory ATPase GspE/PulE/Tfp pilus assembly ATPase PilB-like protein
MSNNEILSLGRSLVDKGFLNREQMDVCLKKQQETGGEFGVILLESGFIKDEGALMPVLAREMGVGFTLLKDSEIPKDVIAKIPAQFANHYKVIPLKYADHVLTIATTRPLDVHLLDEISLVVNAKLNPVLSTRKDIVEAIRRYYGLGAETIDQIMDAVRPAVEDGEGVTNIEEIESEASISKFFNQILLEAYRDRATDIHIEPFEDALHVRYRVDGVLYDARVSKNIKHFRDSIISRIKILSNLNIAEKRMPQDGRFKVRVGSVDLDLRVSFLPTPYGESVVLRILNAARLYSFRDLGLLDEERKILDGLIKRPHGIIFLTGPTGSGKTTTLYACLAQINTEEKKIITIEDPIEYQLKGITQIQINSSIGLTFARGLRSMLRHDPDIMMVGEVRDMETAQIAIQVALTGHLIFSTLHTNDASSGVTRLLDMGVEPYLITSTVEAFIAQRLVRVLCPQCKQSVRLTTDMMREFAEGLEDKTTETIFESRGCEACHFTGFSGREAIYEFLLMDDSLRQLVMERPTAGRIRDGAVQKGMKTLRRAGWEKVKRGLTSLQEVIRVTQEE